MSSISIRTFAALVALLTVSSLAHAMDNLRLNCASSEGVTLSIIAFDKFNRPAPVTLENPLKISLHRNILKKKYSPGNPPAYDVGQFRILVSVNGKIQTFVQLEPTPTSDIPHVSPQQDAPLPEILTIIRGTEPQTVANFSLALEHGAKYVDCNYYFY